MKITALTKYNVQEKNGIRQTLTKFAMDINENGPCEIKTIKK